MPPDFIYELPPAAMFLTVLGVTGLIALGLHLLFMLRPLAPSRATGWPILSPVVMTLCGTLFVLSVTFLANSIWQMEDRARETVNAEARSLRVMRDLYGGDDRPVARWLSSGSSQTMARPWPRNGRTWLRSGASPAMPNSSLQDIYAAVIQGLFRRRPEPPAAAAHAGGPRSAVHRPPATPVDGAGCGQRRAMVPRHACWACCCW